MSPGSCARRGIAARLKYGTGRDDLERRRALRPHALVQRGRWRSTPMSMTGQHPGATRRPRATTAAGRGRRRRQPGPHPRPAQPAVGPRLRRRRRGLHGRGRRGGGRRAPARGRPPRPRPRQRRHRGHRADHGHPADTRRGLRRARRALRRPRWPPGPSTSSAPWTRSRAPRSTSRRCAGTCGSPAGSGSSPTRATGCGPGAWPAPRATAACRRPPGYAGAPTPARRGARRATSRVVVIGASTGGPPALATILADLPADLPVPLLVVQHMADGFVEGLATWLDGLSPLPVVMAEHGRRLRPGVVHVAPAGSTPCCGRGCGSSCAPRRRASSTCRASTPRSPARPRSAASHAVGVLLTGMGRDGAAGLRMMRDAGCLTIGQDEPTCVVWGMPAAAQALGAVEVELPLPEIAAAIAAAVAVAPSDGRRREAALRRRRLRGCPRLPARDGRAGLRREPPGRADRGRRRPAARHRRGQRPGVPRGLDGDGRRAASGSGCSTASPCRRPTSSATPRRWRRCAAGCCPSCCAAPPGGTGR